MASVLSLLLLLVPTGGWLLQPSQWRPQWRPQWRDTRCGKSQQIRRLSCLNARKKVPKNDSESNPFSYTISYSPNFNRHLVTQECRNSTDGGTNSRKTVIKSFLWLDEAQRTFPEAKIELMDPPPPPFYKTEEAELLSKVVAGAGINETFIYYLDDGNNSTTQSNHANNGGTYLLRFLQKLYSALPTITPAEIHRGVMNKFPRLAFYDAAHIHERLFFLLAPLPSEEMLSNLRVQSNNPGSKKRKKKTAKSLSESENDLSHFMDDFDFPVLFHQFGYGAGMRPSQLVQALQTLPQYWLAIYMSDSSGPMKRPQDFLPYIYYHLNAHPDTMNSVRKELDPLLQGVNPVDVASLAHAKVSLGLSWDQCRLLLYALPTLRSCDSEPNWELCNQGHTRNTFVDENLQYLRLRFQLDPPNIFGLIKTHTRLSSYSVQNMLKPHSDDLQRLLHLQSDELQQLVIRTPSILGNSKSSINERLNFLSLEVGMSREEIKKSVLKQPSLLQYSMANLKEKHRFFIEELQISDKPSIAKIFVSRPLIWGLSLERNLRPTAMSLGDFCGLSLDEVGYVVQRAPALLVLSWKSNLEPTLEFLTERLQLSPSELRDVVKTFPLVLVHSIHSSLNPKIEMLEKRLSKEKSRETIIKIPSLLTLHRPILEKRLEKSNFLIDKGGQSVLQFSLDGKLLTEFTNVKAAALNAGVSLPHMYRVVKGEKVVGGKFKYVYKSSASSSAGPSPIVGNDLTSESCLEEKGRDVEVSLANSSDASYLPIFVSGRVYPPGDPKRNRGLRFSGGLAIAMPSLPWSFANMLQQALEESKEGQFIFMESSQSDLSRDSGLRALMGYPLLNPSRRRCSLYVCHMALKVVSQLLLVVGRQSGQKALSGSTNGTDLSPCPLSPPVRIDIVTDSSYAYHYLQDSDKLLEWGSQPRMEDFVYDGEEDAWEANLNLIHPLSRAYYRLVKEDIPKNPLFANLTISFVLQPTNGAATESQVSTSSLKEKMGNWASEAAKRQYTRYFSQANLSAVVSAS